ncbi:MAG TPA: hypothetical protein VGL56_13540 [Fimbriimonadaceae bacterium]|jgi:hypothetical protein
MDALIAAPLHHSLVMENEHVRVLNTHVQPGETVPLHTHEWPAVNYFLSFSDFIRRDENGVVLLDTAAKGLVIAPGAAHWSQPLGAHTLENVGQSVLKVLSVELKQIS